MWMWNFVETWIVAVAARLGLELPARHWSPVVPYTAQGTPTPGPPHVRAGSSLRWLVFGGVILRAWSPGTRRRDRRVGQSSKSEERAGMPEGRTPGASTGARWKAPSGGHVGRAMTPEVVRGRRRAAVRKGTRGGSPPRRWSGASCQGGTAPAGARDCGEHHRGRPIVPTSAHASAREVSDQMLLQRKPSELLEVTSPQGQS